MFGINSNGWDDVKLHRVSGNTHFFIKPVGKQWVFLNTSTFSLYQNVWWNHREIDEENTNQAASLCNFTQKRLDRRYSSFYGWILKMGHRGMAPTMNTALLNSRLLNSRSQRDAYNQLPPIIWPHSIFIFMKIWYNMMRDILGVADDVI